MGIRPMSAIFDFRDEVDKLADEAAEAGLEADQIASELRSRAALIEDQGLPRDRET